MSFMMLHFLSVKQSFKIIFMFYCTIFNKKISSFEMFSNFYIMNFMSQLI